MWPATGGSDVGPAEDILPGPIHRRKLCGGSHLISCTSLMPPRILSACLVADALAGMRVLTVPLVEAHDYFHMQALAAWVQRHARVLTTASAPSGEAAGPSLPEQIEALHSSESAPEQQPQYWPLLQRLVALGMTEDAVGLLGLHSAWQLAYAGGRNQQMLSLVRHSP